MKKVLLKILWWVIILSFIALQVYNIVKTNYTDVVNSILTVVILLLLIVAYTLIGDNIKVEKEKNSVKEESIPADGEDNL